MSNKRWCSLGCAALLVALALQPQALALEERLRTGHPVQGLLEIPEDIEGAPYTTYVFEVDDDVLAARLELQATADLDIFLDVAEIESYDSVLALSNDSTGAESIVMLRDGEPQLETRRYYVDVTYGRQDAPRMSNGDRLRAVPYTLTLTLHRREIAGKLTPGEVVSGSVDPDRGPFRSYEIEVPERTPLLRLDLAADGADLDLRVRRGRPMLGMLDADQVAVSPAGSETLIIRPDVGASLLAGRYYVDVFDQAWLDWPNAYRLVASFRDTPPDGLLELPTLPRDATGVQRALYATVEILHAEAGGTGVLISDRGYILTNHHVIEAIAERGARGAKRLLVALTDDAKEASKVRFQAEVVAHSSDLDLALIRVTGDLFGRALPAAYRFPTIAIGDPAALQLTDPLMCIGYPDAGGLGTRVSVTVTRGIVAGFERRGPTQMHLKTDAEINAGNSGGPVVNQAFELIGIATETISEDGGNGQIGYVRPIWLVPDAWWETAGVER